MSRADNPIFRAATRADISFIVGLIHEDSVVSSVERPDEPELYERAFAAIDADPNQMLMIADLGGERAGTFQLTFTPGIVKRGCWRCTIEGVHVGPAFRNRGLGRQMMEWAVDRARERQCWVVQLTSNKARENAHRFYERLGFAPSHEGFKLVLR